MTSKVLNILIVDDEQPILDNMSEYFGLDDHKIFTASGGVEAQEILLNNTVDVLITDVKMPKGSGLDLLKKINDNGNRPAIIIVTTGFSENPKKEFEKWGADYYFNKPVDLEKLDEIFADFMSKAS